MFPRWLWWSLLAVVSWGVWAVLYKFVEKDLSATHNQAISTLGILPVIGVLALFRGSASPGANESSTRLGIVLALCGGIVSCLGNIPYYNLLGSEQAVTVVPFTAMYPLVTILLAVTLLRERLNRVQALGIATSLVAIYLLNVRDDRSLFSNLFAGVLAAIVLWGTAGFLQKVATNRIAGSRAALWFLLAFVPMGAIILMLDPIRERVEMRVVVISAVIGFSLAFGNFAILVALASGGKASVVVPLTGLYPLVAIPIALAQGERVGVRESIGIVLAIAAVVMLVKESPADAPDAPNPQVGLS
jgi:transporter family protein